MDTEKKSLAQGKALIGRAQYQTIASSGIHAIVVDEPHDLNGSDTGMNPFGLLLSSLGSCTVITLRMYADRKMWVVEEINCELEIFSVPNGHLIERRLTFKGELTPKQNERLLDIANHCPIHKILSGTILMETQLA